MFGVCSESELNQMDFDTFMMFFASSDLKRDIEENTKSISENDFVDV